MKITLFCSFFFLIFSLSAEIKPVEGIEPSGTLPILYINTENSVPVDQKETYINAEYWLDCMGFSQYENIGSADKPQKLGIRGRGNTSWRREGQKPYKLKLDKKTELLGMGKNKHWALLARVTNYHLFNEVLAFELGRKLGMPFVPAVRPVEVVLNGTYIGLYFLTETIRIDDNRLEIAEQPEENEDPATIADGWLVEMDNNREQNQIRIPQPQGYDLLITHHTPELASKAQTEWLTDQFQQITQSINSQNTQENHWESLVDLESLAKHQIVEECLQNFDGYLGSCYIHKDAGGKWCFGPLWDFSASWVYKTEMLAERENQQLIGEFFKFPVYRKELRKVWNEYMENVGTDWVEPFLRDYHDLIKAAVEQSVKVWPDTPLSSETGRNHMHAAFLANTRFNHAYFNEKCITHDINFKFIDLSKNGKEISKSEAASLFSIKINDIPRNESVVSTGDDVIVRITPLDNNIYYSIYSNGKRIERAEDGSTEIVLNNISSDIVFTIVCSESPEAETSAVIKGTVKDRKEKPVKNAEISTSYQTITYTTTSDENGYWELPVFNPDGGYCFILNVMAEGFEETNVAASLSDLNDIVLKSVIPMDYYLKINATSKCEGYDLGAIEVNLYNAATSNLLENYVLSPKGDLSIKNLPEGKYLLNIDGSRVGLENYFEAMEVVEEEDFDRDVFLKECPVAPSDILLYAQVTEAGKYKLTIDLQNLNPRLPYEYFAELNGRKYDFSDYLLQIKDLSVGSATLKIYAVTPSSSVSAAKSFEINFKDTDSSSPVVEITDTTDYQYYNLKGISINNEISGPGIYIRSDGKKLIKK